MQRRRGNARREEQPDRLERNQRRLLRRLRHHGVARCLVTATTAAEDGSEVPRAFVVRTDTSLCAGELLDYLRPRLSAHKLPREIIFVEELPLGPTGKLASMRARRDTEAVSGQLAAPGARR